MSDIVIGIDLGTTNSCVSVYHKNKLEILENKEGYRITPSFVYFISKDVWLVGQQAKDIAGNKPANGVYEVKRLIGRQYDDPHVQKNLQYLVFEVQKSDSNVPEIIISDKDTVVKKTPQEICTLILKKLKADAEDKLGHAVDKAVIAVPAYFNKSQRDVTLAASQEAGFTVVKLLNEPIAAAISYYYEEEIVSKENSYSLVYDLGGGTFDVAILSCKDSVVQVIGVDGETHLGGQDFTNLLLEHVLQILIDKYSYDPKKDRRALRRLINECEETKKTLSQVEEFEISLEGIVPTNNRVVIPITRAEFENMADDRFSKTIDIVDRCLKQNNLTTKNMKEVILSGGSSRIPKIQSMIQDFFGGQRLCQLINPDECVARGAAIQAAMLSKDKTQAFKDFTITDVACVPVD